ncbi:MAG: VOC family protein [Shimia sp.]|uniref:VOC family protein n=1 Tax=Shimia sp. TaxID=1954381 RepID=UPI00405A1B87
MRFVTSVSIAFFAMAGFAVAEPFQEVTVGVPVASIVDAEAWYLNLLGSDVEVLKPVPGVVEFKVAPNVWLQIFEQNGPQASDPIIRFLVDDIEAAQAQRAEFGINTGEAIDIPTVVAFSEFSDPDGNALGLYDLP